MFRTHSFSFVLLSLLLTAFARAEILNVPGDYPTIQDAIYVAPLGAEVIVAPGIYPELINFISKAITVRSSDGPEVTIIDGTGLNDSVVKCVNGEGADTVLDGFTVTGGSATFGGGMLIDQSSPTIRNCVFLGNNADDSGGAIYGILSSSVVEASTFEANVSSVKGGAIYWVDSTPSIASTTFTANQSETGGAMAIQGGTPVFVDCLFESNIGFGVGEAGNGGALWVSPETSGLTMLLCSLVGNRGSFGAGGISSRGTEGLYVSCLFEGNVAENHEGGAFRGGSSTTFIGCSFIANSSDLDDGGAIKGDGSFDAINCLFRDNHAGGVGGAFRVESVPAIVTNCTFVGNSGGGNGAALRFDGSASTSLVSNSIVWGNTGAMDVQGSASVVVSYSDIQGSFGGEGNIDADPLFVDPDNGDYRFLSGSPCIDAADNDALPADTFDVDGDGDTDELIPFDLDGLARGVNDPQTEDTGNGVAPIVDMGAYEFQPCLGDVNGDDTVDPLDSGFIFARFGCEYPDDGINCLAADANSDGSVDPLDVGFVLARFGTCD